MSFPRSLAIAALCLCFAAPTAAEEYNFSDNQNVNEKDCWAMETRIDKYLALADAALKSAETPNDDAFKTGQAYLGVAADFSRVFTKFCEDA